MHALDAGAVHLGDVRAVHQGDREDPEEDDLVDLETQEVEAEEGSFDPALVYDVRRGLEDAAQTLADEVQRSIEHHRSQEAAREVSRVLLSGEAALIPNLDGYLGELLDVPTGRANPVEKLSANRSNITDDQLRAMEPVLAVAFGLAMEDE